MFELAGVERRHQSTEGSFSLRVPEFRIAAGERIVLLGPSGSGKSTMLDLLALLAAPDRAGRFVLTVDGRSNDLQALWAEGRRDALTRLRARHMGYVLQTGGLLPYLSVRENILLSRRLLGLPLPGPLNRLAGAVGIDGLLERRPAQLSIGQRQRAALVRALVHEPALLLADEPTAALDPAMAARVIDTLVLATAEVGAALLLVTHDVGIAKRTAGRTVHCRPLPDASASIVGD